MDVIFHTWRKHLTFRNFWFIKEKGIHPQLKLLLIWLSSALLKSQRHIGLEWLRLRILLYNEWLKEEGMLKPKRIVSLPQSNLTAEVFRERSGNSRYLGTNSNGRTVGGGVKNGNNTDKKVVLTFTITIHWQF